GVPERRARCVRRGLGVPWRVRGGAAQRAAVRALHRAGGGCGVAVAARARAVAGDAVPRRRALAGPDPTLETRDAGSTYAAVMDDAVKTLTRVTADPLTGSPGKPVK